jgi:glycosyltransferase involved in cell wall biosynthesis
MQLGLVGRTRPFDLPRYSIKIVTTGLGYGGAEAQVAHLAQGFHQRGHRVSVVSLLPLDGHAERLRQSGIALESLNMKPGAPDPRAAVHLSSIIRRFGPDVVHSQMIHANLIARMSRLLAPGPVYLSTAQNTYEYAVAEGDQQTRKGGWRDWAYRLTDRLADLTTNVSQAGVERYVADRLSSKAKTVFVPNGIDLERFSGNPLQGTTIRRELDPGAEFVWLAVGRLEAQKDYPNLLRAFNQVLAHKPSAKLWIAGQGSLRAELQGLSASLGLQGAVRFLGLRKDVGNLMCAADAFVMSSAWEGLPMVLLEACKIGLPVVATDVGGNRDVVLNGQSGLLVTPKDSPALAGAMLQLMDLSVAGRNDMAALGQHHVSQTYSLEVVLDRWEGLYSDLIRRRKIPLLPA